MTASEAETVEVEPPIKTHAATKNIRRTSFDGDQFVRDIEQNIMSANNHEFNAHLRIKLIEQRKLHQGRNAVHLWRLIDDFSSEANSSITFGGKKCDDGDSPSLNDTAVGFESTFENVHAHKNAKIQVKKVPIS